MTLTPLTKKYRRRKNLFFMLSTICMLLPFAVYVPKAFINATEITKIAVGFMGISAIVLTLINFWAKLNLRTPLWLFLIACYVALDNIMPLVILMAITTALDEFLFAPLYRSDKEEFRNQKSIDRRLP